MSKKSLISLLALMFIAITGFLQAAKAVEKVTKKETPPPGTINFVGKNVVATARGTFTKWSITKSSFDLNDLEKAVVEIEIDVASIDTKNKRRDKHLRTPDFFDVEKYPTATLKIYSIIPVKDTKTYSARIDFNLHGIKKTYAVLNFKIVEENPIKVEGKFTFNRIDFKIGGPKGRNPMTPKEDIPITFSATLPK
ncbi:YceI family protein [bacterium AH-315-P07]|nr:YceI family protein [bacterium AH-315-P07]